MKTSSKLIFSSINSIIWSKIEFSVRFNLKIFGEKIRNDEIDESFTLYRDERMLSICWRSIYCWHLMRTVESADFVWHSVLSMRMWICQILLSLFHWTGIPYWCMLDRDKSKRFLVQSIWIIVKTFFAFEKSKLLEIKLVLLHVLFRIFSYRSFQHFNKWSAVKLVVRLIYQTEHKSILFWKQNKYDFFVLLFLFIGKIAAGLFMLYLIG